MPTAVNAALEGVCPWSLRHKLHCFGLAFLDLLAVLRRRENKARLARFIPFRNFSDSETVRVISRGDFEPDSRALFNPDRGRIELVLFRRDFDNLSAFRCTRRLVNWFGDDIARPKNCQQ